MVTLNRIYTGTGDNGETSLGNGRRVSKTDLRVEAYGTVDEVNSTLGLAALHAEGMTKTSILKIQNDLFDLGADLCYPPEEGVTKLRITPAHTLNLEKQIDQINEHLQPLKSFVLPGGTKLSAALHQARTVCRRAERRVVELSRSEGMSQDAIKYLNRLSDWMFVVARMSNGKGQTDMLWIPGENVKCEDT